MGQSKPQPKPRLVKPAPVRGAAPSPPKPAPPPPKPVNDLADLDPFEAKMKRDPLPTSSEVRVVVLIARETETDRADGEAVAQSLTTLLSERRRPSEVRIEPIAPDGVAAALTRATQDAEQPIILIAASRQPWTAAHLDPLLQVLDLADHVVGHRRAGWFVELKRMLARWPWRFLMAVPAFDLNSPASIHRRDPWKGLILQSRGRFAQVEWLAKATFQTQIVSTVPIPPLDSIDLDAAGHHGVADRWAVLTQPRFQPNPA